MGTTPLSSQIRDDIVVLSIRIRSTRPTRTIVTLPGTHEELPFVWPGNNTTVWEDLFVFPEAQSFADCYEKAMYQAAQEFWQFQLCQIFARYGIPSDQRRISRLALCIMEHNDSPFWLPDSMLFEIDLIPSQCVAAFSWCGARQRFLLPHKKNAGE